MAIELNGTTGITTPDVNSDGLTVDSTTLVVDEANNRVGIGTSSPTAPLEVASTGSLGMRLNRSDGAFNVGLRFATQTANDVILDGGGSSEFFRVLTQGSERARITSAGEVLVGKSSNSFAAAGAILRDTGDVLLTADGTRPLVLNRLSSDGELLGFYQATSQEGNISVSGTTVSYNGGHLARWSQLADNTRDETILKGTVMTNLDQMAAWTTDGVTEDNEQLNCMAVSSVEGDPNVAGVFVSWDNDDDVYTNDMNIAMTGDMIIRIAAGTSVARGDLLMSAGDGTAKPQGDDIVRSKTIAKVTSTHVTCTYDDGSYCVPCVLMAC